MNKAKMISIFPECQTKFLDHYTLEQGWPTCGACAMRGALDA